MTDSAAIALSVVVPVQDEEPALPEFHSELKRAIMPLKLSYEIIYVDDLSQDNSLCILKSLAEQDSQVEVISTARRTGKTGACAAGYRHARGKYVVTIDADLQDDPADIPALLAPLGTEFDMVCGRRQGRRESLLTRRLPSLISNWCMRLAFPIKVNDYGSGLKAFDKHIAVNLPSERGMHRFMPVYAVMLGARVCEVPVRNRPRRYGRSKCGFGRNWETVSGFFRTLWFYYCGGNRGGQSPTDTADRSMQLEGFHLRVDQGLPVLPARQTVVK